jgi:hypothetical protein
MAQLPVLADVDPGSLRTLPCCGVKNTEHPGRCAKLRWLPAQFKKGMRAKVLLTPDGRQCGFIEYLPGEHALRGVEAAGYTFIHCLWTYFRQYQHQGLGGKLIDACIEDARRDGTFGVAVVARESPWLASPAIFLANGFEVADTVPPDYQLLVKKFDPSFPDPKFQTGWEKRRAAFGRGLTIVRSPQCPHTAKFAAEIEEAARDEFGLETRIVEIRSARDVRRAPTPYTVFAILLNGRLLADRQISRTRFRNIMKKAFAAASPAKTRKAKRP